jgi:hypothetical protein
MEWDPSLKKPFIGVFSAATYNLGPETVCKPHLDFANVPFGFCSITSLGSFDWKKGGHFVLWDCKLVIQFRPGSTIHVRSAIVTHSNLGISKGEKRYSFTQYTAGGLVRWLDNECQTWNQYAKKLGKKKAQALEEERRDQWINGLDIMGSL